MNIKLVGFAIFSLFTLMMVPAYASVTSLSLEKGFYTVDENFKLIGTQDAKDTIFIVIRDLSGNFKGMLSDPTPDQGDFSAIPRPVTNFFDNEGIYNATAFTDNEKEETGFTIKLEFDGQKVFEQPEFVLSLRSISDVTIDELKTVSFTVSVTDSSVENVMYSLEKNPPSGATIDSTTGKFVWTPTSSHGNSPGAKYTFDIVATKGAQIDRESITITVNEPSAVNPTPEPDPEPEPITEPKELGLASFVDESKDPQSYVDRYKNEVSYKKWFDDNYSEYSSIYQAVGLDEPKVQEPVIEEPEFGECGEGTRLVDGVCSILEEPEFGECGEGTKLIKKTCTVIENIKVKPWWQFW